MTVPFEDLRLAAARARAAATHARQARDLNRCSTFLRDRLTAVAKALDTEADWLEELAADAERERNERRQTS